MNIDKTKLKAAIPIDEYYQSELGPPAKTNQNHWIYFCCFHSDEKRPNLVVYRDGGFKCFCCDVAGNVFEFYRKRHNLLFLETLTVLAKRYAPELIPNNNKGQPQKIVAEYSYLDESGRLLYQVIRYEPKDFKQRRPDGDGGWIWGLDGTRRVPYKLPELIAGGNPVFVPGGEKDVDTLVSHGFESTTNSGGEGNWKPEFNEYLQDRDVTILEDNDDKGQKHGQVVSQNLLRVAKSVKIVRFPELPKHGDVSNYLENHTPDEFLKLVETAPAFKGDYPAYFNECPPVKPTTPSDKPDKNDGVEKERLTQSKILIELAGCCELFHNPESETFASVTIDGHEETWPIRSRGFKLWLLNRFYQQQAKAPGAQAQADAMGVLEANAQFDGPEHPVHVRIAGHEGNIYLNIGDDQCRVVEVTPDGWEIITKSPVKFIHPKGCLPLPVPETGGSVDDLRCFVNIEDEDGWKLFVATLIAAFKPTGPYPVTVLQGEQGSSKSTAMRLKRALIDPNVAALRTSPREARDLMIYAKNSWLLSFDNLSKIPDWLADSFCRLATGGGFSTRELYSNNEENIISATRIIDLNGIEEIITRDDLLDRCVFIRLPSISESKRKDEESFWAEFHEAQPRILSGLLDAVAVALKNHPHVKLEYNPRMADFARWVVAAEPELGWEPGSFLKAYASNRASAVQMGLEASAVAQAIETMTETVPEWQGTATELLDQLDKVASEKVLRMKEWPKSPSVLANKLRRLGPAMRAIGTEIYFDREGHKRKRIIEIRKIKGNAVLTIRNEDNKDKDIKSNNLDADDDADAMRTADDSTQTPSATLSALNYMKSNGKDDADDADDEFPLFSNPGLEGSV